MADQVPHLTTVTHRLELSTMKPWEASCDCGWKQQEATKRKAVAAAEVHWLSMPVVVK